MPWGAAIAAGGSILSSAISSSAAGDAAQTQAGSANAANALSSGAYNTAASNLSPYLTGGTNALNILSQLLGMPTPASPGPQGSFTINPAGPTSDQINQIISANPNVPAAQIQQMLAAGNTGGLIIPAGMQLTQAEAGTLSQGTPALPPGLTAGSLLTPPSASSIASSPILKSMGVGPDGTFSAANFANTPGYQFTLGQGLDAITNSALARGGITGNTLKDLTNYAEGLASTTYNQDFANYANIYNTLYNQGTNQNLNIYNMLRGLTTSGQTAATNLGQIGANAANTQGSNLIGAGNALAAGQVGSANAIAGGINSGISNLISPPTISSNSPLNYLINAPGASPDVTIGGGWTPTY